MSHQSQNSNREAARRPLVHLLMVTIFLLLTSFSAWLVWITYFREYFDPGIAVDGEYGNGTVRYNPKSYQRFHSVSDTVTEQTDPLPFCLVCHEDLPHAVSKEKRAFLNAHGYNMVCEICHTKRDPNNGTGYRWVNAMTGAIEKANTVSCECKIFPPELASNHERIFGTPEDREFAVNYKVQEVSLTERQKEQALDRVHEGMKKAPVSCDDCHTTGKSPYLPFAELGYTETRVDELVRIEVAGMVKKYEHFFLPNLTRGSGN